MQKKKNYMENIVECNLNEFEPPQYGDLIRKALG